MEEILIVKDLKKTFKLTAKQRKINKTNDLYKIAVDGLSFKAYKGEIYGLLGPNGAGKTTTLRIISTLIKADSGDVFVDGIDIAKNPDMVRQKIGFLTSELKLEDFLLLIICMIIFLLFIKLKKHYQSKEKIIYLKNLALKILKRLKLVICQQE